jgi:hypothetical protein
MSEHAERALDHEAAVAPRAGTDAAEGARPSLNLDQQSAPAGQPPLAPRDLVALQRGAGNMAVAQLLARRSTPVQRIGAVIPSTYHHLSEKEKVAKAIESKDVGDVKDIHDFTAATVPERYKLMDILVDQTWVGPRDEWALEALWGTFGDGLLAAAKSEPDRWTKCVKRDRDLMDLPAVKAIPPKFLEDVRGLAYRYLDDNEKYCKAELKKLGVGEEPMPWEAKPDPAKEMADLREAAKVVKQAQEAQNKLKGTTVGLHAIPAMGPDGHPMYSYSEVKFSSGSPPTQMEEDALPPGTPRQFPDLQFQYDVLQGIVDGLGAKYPAIYAVVSQGGPEGVAAVAGDNPDQAKAMVVKTVTTVKDNIAKTRPQVAADLPWDLEPLHQQLMTGAAKAGSGTDWTDPIAKALASASLERHQSHDFWKTMGLTSLAAAAFILAEFATGGLATFALVAAGVTIGAGQAAMSWDKATTLATAKQSGMSKESELVSQGQVDMATFEAVLNTALVAVDFLTAIKPLGRAFGGAIVKEGFQAGSAAARGAISGLEKVGSMARAEAKPLLERAVPELGIETVVKRTGIKAEDLLKVVGEDSPIAPRLKGFGAIPEEIAKLSAEDFVKRSGQLAAEMAHDPKTAEALAKLAVERLGPAEVVKRNGGWKALSLALGNESKAGKAIMAWRDGMMADIEAFVKTLPGGVDEGGKAAVKRTGTQGKFTNDFDVSLLGSHSSANRDAVRSFMAGRLGTSPDGLEFSILADFFTDPTRLHLYDKLSPALRTEISSRAEKVAEATIFAKTLNDAEKAGNKALADDLRAQMKALGIKEVPFKPLVGADRSTLYTKIDDLHGQLEKAIEANDQAAQKRLVEEIGDTQGLINAAEGGGYFSGGGTKALVSLKEGLAKGAIDLLPEQKYTALLDQLPKLYGECNNLLRAGMVAGEDTVAAIKGIAKYGERFSKLASEMGVAGQEAAKLEELATKFGKLVKQAKGEADVTILQRLATDAQSLQQELGYLLDGFNGASREVLVRLSQQAGLSGKAVDLAKIQFLTMASAKLARASQAARNAVATIIADIVRNAEKTASAPVPPPPPPPPKQ